MRKSLLYPARKRCRSCRKFFGFEVVKGEFCSYSCMGVRNPYELPYSEWPRQHYYWAGGWPRPKQKRNYYSQAEADNAKTSYQSAYLCDFCWHWHVGGHRPQ